MMQNYVYSVTENRAAMRNAARIAEPAAGGACSARAHACDSRTRARVRVPTPKADSKVDSEGRLGRLTRRDNSEDRLLVCACVV